MNSIEEGVRIDYVKTEEAVRDLTNQARDFLAVSKLPEAGKCLGKAEGRVLDYHLKLRESQLSGGIKDETYERASLSLLREPIVKLSEELANKQRSQIK